MRTYPIIARRIKVGDRVLYFGKWRRVTFILESPQNIKVKLRTHWYTFPFTTEFPADGLMLVRR